MTVQISMVPAKWLEVSGTPIFYTTLGDGPLAVVTVGLGAEGRVAVTDQHQRIAKAARLIIVRWPAVTTIADVVTAMAAVLDAEKIKKAVWWGSSIAGAISLFAAATAPERVRGLIIASSALPVPRLSLAVSLSRFILKLIPARVGLRLMLKRTGLDPASPGAAVLAQSLTKRDMQNWIAWAGQYHRLGLKPLEKIPGTRLPVLIIGCEDDPSVPKAELDRLVAFFPAARTRIFPDGGHFPQIRHREEFEGSILTFLKRFRA